MMETETLTQCELLVLKVIWSSDEPLSVQEIAARVNQTYQKEWKIPTVSTFLGHIVRKGYLTMERKGRTFFYHPVVSEEEYGKQEITRCVDFWSNGRLDVFLAAFLEERPVSAEEKSRIRKMIEAMDW